MNRIFDILISLFTLVFVLPLLAIIAVIIKLDGTGGSIFDDAPYRLGKDGKLFKMYKFRTMIPGAHDLIEFNVRYVRIRNKRDKNGGKLKSKEDPRITKFGGIIRALDFDELPQLFNVLIGDMGIIGPRPYFEKELNKYPKFKKQILKVKPGITGIWQVTGRNNIPLHKRVELDAAYAIHHSLLSDFVIFLKTPFVVIFRIGAW